MAQVTDFLFDTYTVDASGTELTFTYCIHLVDEPDIELKERLKLPFSINPSDEIIQRILQALHIGLGISYYKLFVPPTFTLTYELSHTASHFWNTVYSNGLGEFLYKNKLDPATLATFSGAQPSPDAKTIRTSQKAILGIGGGKDSIVGYHLLEALNIPVSGFILTTGGHTGQAQAVADIMNVPTMQIQRTIDPQVNALNSRPDTYNGHVPISMIFALCGILAAYHTKSSYVVVANEASASLPQTTWQDNPVNHQWSKSLDFEKAFQEFVKTEICTGITYFSIVRPMSSIAIAKLFSRHTDYFETFTSDNGVFKIDPARRPTGRWSIDSPKSLSSYILLAPWLKDAELQKIFGINLLNVEALEPLFKQLTGIEGHPPLDCVGTVDELKVSLSLLATQDRFSNTRLMKLARDYHILDLDITNTLHTYLATSREHALPAEIQKVLLDHIENQLAS